MTDGGNNMSFFGLFDKKPPAQATLEQLTKNEDWGSILLNQSYVEILTTEARKGKEEDFRVLLHLAGAGENEIVAITIREIVRQGHKYVLDVISDYRLDTIVSAKERIDLAINGVKNGAIKAEMLSLTTFQKMCEKHPETRETLVRYYLARVKQKIEDRKRRPFADYSGDWEMREIIKYLQETPIPEIQEFLRNNSLYLRFSERDGKCASQ